MQWNKVKDGLPDCGREVVLFSRVVQNTSFFLVDLPSEGLFWMSNHEDIDEPVTIFEDQSWLYLDEIEPPFDNIPE